MKTRIFSTALALIMILGTLLLTGCGDKGFDYAKEDLSAYVSFKTADYKNLPIEIQTDVTDYSVTTEVSDRFEEYAEEDASIFVTDKAIEDNDLVKLYYRGATVDEDGNETEFQGGSNLGSEEPTLLWIGSGSFIEGFEDAMKGLVPSDTSLSFREDGTVGENDLIVLDITGTYDGDANYIAYTNLTLTLSETDLIEESVKAELVGKNVGEKLIFSLDLNADSDSELETVVFAATVHKVIDMNAKKLELTFPEDYGNEELAGKRVNFYAVAQGVASINKENLEKLGFTTDESDVVEAYKVAIKDELSREYAEEQAENEEAFKNIVSNAIWAELVDNVEVKAYPDGVIDRYIKTEKNNLEYEYNASPDASSIKSQFSTIEAYAKDKYGADDYESVIAENAENFVKGKLTLYSIANDMGLTKVTKSEKKEIKAKIEAEYVAYYSQLYSIYNSIYGYGYSEEEIKVISEGNAKATADGLSDTYLEESVMKDKILNTIYADYNTDYDGGLISWVSDDGTEEETTEE